MSDTISPCYCLKHGKTTVARNLNEQPDCPVCALVEDNNRLKHASLGASKELIKDVEAAREEADQLRCAVALHEETIKCLQAQKNAYSIWDNIDVPALVSRIKGLEKENKELDSQLANQRAAYDDLHKDLERLTKEQTYWGMKHLMAEETAQHLDNVTKTIPPLHWFQSLLTHWHKRQSMHTGIGDRVAGIESLIRSLAEALEVK